jgi:polyisoprenoid-binding protein YceI
MIRTAMTFSWVVVFGFLTAHAWGAEGELTAVTVESNSVKLSPENTRIQFVGTHVGAKPDPRTGVFAKFSGKVDVDAGKKVLKSVTVDIATESLETPIQKLTNHLRSPDFFDVRTYPSAKFQSTSISAPDAAGMVQVTGNLTLLKETREVKFPAKVNLTDKGLALEAKFTLDRTAYGMTFMQDRVNKEIEVTVWVGRPTSAK